jgi:hypothetical protein
MTDRFRDDFLVVVKILSALIDEAKRTKEAEEVFSKKHHVIALGMA